MAKVTRRKSAPEPRPTAQEPPPPPPAARIGDLLRQARQAAGGDLVEIGHALRIRPDFLKAIEDNDGKKLPAPVYALGFVRSYADYLGFDGAEAARRFKAESCSYETKFDLALPMAVPDRGLPGGPLLLVGLIIAGCAYGIWYYLGSAERHRPERVAAVPGELLPPPPAPAAAPEGEGQPAPEPPPPEEPLPPAAAQPPAPPSAAPAPPQQPTPTQPVPTQPPVGEAAAPPPVPAPQAGRVFGATEGASRIAIVAAADSWIQVLDPDKRVLAQRTLHPGETYRVPDQPGLKLRTGNAGGLNIAVDGQPIPPIGKSGKFRSVALDPGKLGGKGGGRE